MSRERKQRPARARREFFGSALAGLAGGSLAASSLAAQEPGRSSAAKRTGLYLEGAPAGWHWRLASALLEVDAAACIF